MVDERPEVDPDGASAVVFVPCPVRLRSFPSSVAWQASRLNPFLIYTNKLSRKKGCHNLGTNS
jgi:hypothetical protein